MRSRYPLLGLALSLSCNALLDNNPRELSNSSGGAGIDRGGGSGEASGGSSAQGGSGAAATGGDPGAAAGEPGTPAGGSSDGEGGTDGGAAAGGPAAGGVDTGSGGATGGRSTGGTSTGGLGSGGASSGGGGSGSLGGSGGAAQCPNPCSLPHAQSACMNGACVITSCNTGFLDANLSAADGCETGEVATSGLLLWFMADRGLTVSGSSVSDWTDQSPNHFHATQSGAAQMPKKVQPATGPAMVDFDGVDDALKLPTGFAAFSGTSFFAVASALPAETCAGILSFSNGPDIDDIEFGRHHTNLLYYEVVGEFVEGVTNAFEANRRLLVSIVQSTSGATQLRINGVVNASKTIRLPANISRAQNYLGRDVYTECPQSFKGQLGEVILFNRPVSDAERLKIQSYLGAKWSVPVQ